MECSSLFEKRLLDDSNTFVERLREACEQFLLAFKRIIQPVIDALMHWIADLSEMNLETYLVEYHLVTTRPQNRVERFSKRFWGGIFHNRNG